MKYVAAGVLLLTYPVLVLKMLDFIQPLPLGLYIPVALIGAFGFPVAAFLFVITRPKDWGEPTPSD